MTICVHKNCDVGASFGERDGKAIYCSKHKRNTDINLRHKSCKYKDCTKIPSYGVKGTKLKEFCVDHKRHTDIDLVNKICIHFKCSKKAHYGDKKVKLKEYCSNHKRPTDIRLISNTICVYQDCETSANFGIKDSRLREYCSKHKREIDVDLTHKICMYEGCLTSANFGVQDSKVKEFCGKHKRPTDVDLNKNKKCNYDGCLELPVYGSMRTRPSRCNKHKLVTDINVVSKLCIHDGCPTIASYGAENTKLKQYCVKHKRSSDINLSNKKCVFKNCKDTASYGVKGAKLKEYCSKHRRETDVDLKHKVCIYEDCKIIALFGVKGTALKEYCVKHKRLTDIDLRSKQCIYKDCKANVTYGLLFQEKTHCLKHRQHNEYKITHPKCSIKKCKIQPCYTDQKDNYPLRCEDHKTEEDKNVVERPCTNCHLTYYLREDGLCNDCYDYSVRKVHKISETKLKDFLEEEKIEYTSWDQRPEGSCFKYRPDFILDRGTYILILENDENQHLSYACECEQVRMINLYQDFGGIPVMFVRYNPDTYTDHLGKKHRFTKSRLKRVLQVIKSLELHPPTEGLSVIYLYYNGDNGQNNIEKIDYEKQIVEQMKEMKIDNDIPLELDSDYEDSEEEKE